MDILFGIILVLIVLVCIIILLVVLFPKKKDYKENFRGDQAEYEQENRDDGERIENRDVWEKD